MTNKLVLVAVIALAAAPAFAQNTQTAGQQISGFDSRWNPFLGCWRIVEEHQGDQKVPIAPGLMVCAQPSGRTGVAVTTSVDGKNVLEQTIIADGSAQPLTQADCSGTQTSDWSRDGDRLFTRVEMECAGRPTRIVSGITQLAKGYWIDAQATVIDGDHDVRLRRYQRTGDQSAGAITPGGGPMSVEDVIEANAKVLSPALEAALVEAGGKFSLDSRTLKQLAEAGVSPSVIDVMVAQTYPDHFRIERPPTYPSGYPVTTGTTSGGSVTIIESTAYPFAMYDARYNSYYYSPFAYPYYWNPGYYPYRHSYGYGTNYNKYYLGYPGGAYYIPGNRGARPIPPPGSPDSPGGSGVVVNGRGYTRVRPAESGDSGANATSTPRTTAGTRSRAGSAASTGTASSPSTAPAASGGDSSGSSSEPAASDSGRRTAPTSLGAKGATGAWPNAPRAPNFGSGFAFANPMKRTLFSVVLVGAGLAFSKFEAGDGLPKPPEKEWAARNEAFARAKVFRGESFDPSKIDFAADPNGGVVDRKLTTCKYKPEDVSGTTPKFDCVLQSGEKVKVKYGYTREIPSEIAATRLMHALGFGADRVSRVEKVRCYGCPFQPFHTRALWEMVGITDFLDKRIDYGSYRDFEGVSVERNLDGEAIEVGPERGWGFYELKNIDPAKGGASRAEIDALRLMAVFLHHWDNKTANQRLTCPESKTADCAHPLAMIQDVGSDFGPKKADLANWKSKPVWADPATCTITMKWMPYGGGTFEDVQVSEEGRRLIGDRLKQIPRAQIEALFNAAQLEDAPQWVAAFEDKVRQIADRAACPSTTKPSS